RGRPGARPPDARRSCPHGPAGRVGRHPGGRHLKRILVADDDPVSRLKLRGVLGRLGFDVLAARDGTEAWAALAKPDAPPLVLLDWAMPGLSGPEVIQRLRELPADVPPH